MKNEWQVRIWAGVVLALETLREIFDENAYARFLRRQKLTRSRESYLAFLHENTRQNERRARCC